MKRLTRELRGLTGKSAMLYLTNQTNASCYLYTGAGLSGAKMKRLTRELRDLTGKSALPCNPAASIFLRHDADQLDMMRAIITGE